MQNKDITSFSTGFISSNEQTSTSAITVTTVETADITINSTAAAILIEGAIHYQVGPTKDIEVMFNTLLKINKGFLKVDTDDVEMKVTRVEMDYLRHFTECYLTSQEITKQDKPEYFDADMYITAKLLLLDIREWQAGQVIYQKIIS